MNPQTLPLNEILVEERFRKDLGDLDGLKGSLQRLGLIQPIIVNNDKRLVAGGRRLAAATELGWASINVVYRDTLSEAELHELELEENKNRKDFTWQEECLLIEKIHLSRTRTAALDGKSWGQRATSDLFKCNVSTINFSLRLAQELRSNPEGEIAKADNATEAWRVLMRQERDKVLAELALRQAQQASDFADASQEHLRISQDGIAIDSELALATIVAGDESKGLEGAEISLARERYLSNPHNDPLGFEDYWKERLALLSQKDKHIYLSKWLLRGDSIKFMQDPSNANRFPAIITDPPYAIDMSMLSQQNTGMGNISTVEEEHQVDENLELLSKFLKGAYNVLTDPGFCVLWCDTMIWQYLYEEAAEVGFKVQRWPFLWVKTHTCMNQSAHCNFTKATEIAMICRKGNAVLAQHQPNNFILSAHDSFKDKMLHPFVKPFDVWKRLIEAVSFENQTILEPFSGEGSGVISMLRCRRRVVGIELNDNHYNALLENVKSHYKEINPDFVFL